MISDPPPPPQGRPTTSGHDHVPLDIGALIRRVRRHLDLSQRELARRLGVAASTVARAERGFAGLRVETLRRILALAGMQLLVVDAESAPVAPMGPDGARDAGGRRCPAHLDPYVAGPDGPAHFPLGWTRRRIPRVCWHLRPERDRRLAQSPHRSRPSDHLSEQELKDQWTSLRRRRDARVAHQRARNRDISRRLNALVAEWEETSTDLWPPARPTPPWAIGESRHYGRR